MMSARILVVEDDAKNAAILVDYLQQAGFAAEVERDGLRAVARVRDRAPDCMLLDLNLNLPVLEGIEVCKQIREFSTVPIAMTTARVDEIDRLLGLELGADDYICKPFSPREVVARAKALLRRVQPVAAISAVAALGLKHDTERIQARIGGVSLALTTVEFRLLEVLYQAKGREPERLHISCTIAN